MRVTLPLRIRCFFLHETDMVQLELRRYRRGDANDCPLQARPAFPGAMPTKPIYHNAQVAIERYTRAELGIDRYDYSPTPTDKQLADPRWPRRCECGYEFAHEDHWQVNQDRLFRRSDTNELVTLGDAPIGALYDAWWYRSDREGAGGAGDGPPFDGYRVGEDGYLLCLKTPAHDWCIDGPASNGTPGQPGWTRTGKVPDLCVSPSIGMPRLHGFLGGQGGNTEPGILYIDQMEGA